MSLGGILSTITSSLVRLNYASAPNSTNFGAHEVAKAKVSLQEEGGVHIFEFHIPTDGAGAALLALAAVAVIAIAIVMICCWCGVKCTQVCCNFICPCAALCRRQKTNIVEENAEVDIRHPLQGPKIQENHQESIEMVPIKGKDSASVQIENE